MQEEFKFALSSLFPRSRVRSPVAACSRGPKSLSTLSLLLVSSYSLLSPFCRLINLFPSPRGESSDVRAASVDPHTPLLVVLLVECHATTCLILWLYEHVRPNLDARPHQPKRARTTSYNTAADTKSLDHSQQKVRSDEEHKGWVRQ